MKYKFVMLLELQFRLAKLKENKKLNAVPHCSIRLKRIKEKPQGQ